jgi:hypothetical protein
MSRGHRIRRLAAAASTPGAFAAYRRAESDKWDRVIRDLSVTLE